MSEMRCDDIADLIEPWAANELTPSAGEATHLQACPACARALAVARRMEQSFGVMTWAPVPAGFTQNVTGRIGNERWRSEELVDRAFNMSLATIGILVAGGLWVVLDLTGMFVVMGGTLALAGDALSRSMATLSLGQLAMGPLLYAAAALAGVAALIIWRWREGDQFF